MGIGKSIEDFLIAEGHQIYKVADIDNEMTDEKVIEFSVSQNAVIITMDKDFGELVYKNKKLRSAFT